MQSCATGSRKYLARSPSELSQIRLLEADGDKLSYVVRADPDGEPVTVNRRMIDITNAHEARLHAHSAFCSWSRQFIRSTLPF